MRFTNVFAASMGIALSLLATATASAAAPTEVSCFSGWVTPSKFKVSLLGEGRTGEALVRTTNGHVLRGTFERLEVYGPVTRRPAPALRIEARADASATRGWSSIKFLVWGWTTVLSGLADVQLASGKDSTNLPLGCEFDQAAN